MAEYIYQVGQDSHDAEQIGSTVAVTSANVRVTSDTAYGIAIFNTPDVFAGDTCTSAVAQLNFTSGSLDDPNCQIHLQDSQVIYVVSTSDNDVSDRPLTTNYTTWNATGVGTGWITTPDFASAVQEVIDTHGTVAKMAVIFKGLSGTNFRFRDYSNTPADAAKLILNITAGGGTSIPVIHNYYARLRG